MHVWAICLCFEPNAAGALHIAGKAETMLSRFLRACCTSHISKGNTFSWQMSACSISQVSKAILEESNV